jgi:hypothetical protein
MMQSGLHPSRKKYNSDDQHLKQDIRSYVEASQDMLEVLDT